MKSRLLRFITARIPSRHDVEMAYLNQSVSIHDLEKRQHEIALGRFRQG